MRRGRLEARGEARRTVLSPMRKSTLSLFGPLNSSWTGMIGIELGESEPRLSDLLKSRLLKDLESKLPGALSLCWTDDCFGLAD